MALCYVPANLLARWPRGSGHLETATANALAKRITAVLEGLGRPFAGFPCEWKIVFLVSTAPWGGHRVRASKNTRAEGSRAKMLYARYHPPITDHMAAAARSYQMPTAELERTAEAAGT